jgi:hypothetical protein
MLSEGIPANDLSYKVFPVKGTQGLVFAIEDFLQEAKTENLLICDISLIPNAPPYSKENEILAIFFFKKPKYTVVN